jgi:hypothetical protein
MTTNMNRLVKVGFEPAGHWLLTGSSLELILHTAMAQETNVLYAFAVDGFLAYVGKTTQSLKKRMQGYKSPASNGNRGGSTNIRNNRNIIAALSAGHGVNILAMRSQAPQQHGEFHVNLSAGLEDSLIRALSPPWNGRAQAVLSLAPSPVRPAALHDVQREICTSNQVTHAEVPANPTFQGVSMIPSAETLFAFARSHQGETLRTLQNKSPFKVEVVGNFLEITPDSSSERRRESRDSVTAVLARLAKTMSFKMSDYKDISFNASYVLALVKRWELPELPVSIGSDRIMKSVESVLKTGKNVKELPEDTAREQMAEYYKKNKATLPLSVREHRELIVQLIRKGLSPEQAFFQVQANGRTAG